MEPSSAMQERRWPGPAKAPHGRPWAIVTLLAIGLTVVACLVIRWRTPPVQPTLALSELVRLNERLVPGNDTNQMFTGWMVEHHADGALKSRSRIVEGVLHGVSEGWHSNGQVQVREHFVRGVSEGILTKWHANGATQSVATIVQGKIHGRFLRWHENGRLSEEVMMENGRPHGASRACYPSGFLKTEVLLKAGQIVEQRFWNDGEMPASMSALAASPLERKGIHD